MDFAIWRTCERFGLRPPGVKRNWDEMEDDFITQSLLVAYNQIREIEEDQMAAAMVGVKI